MLVSYNSDMPFHIECNLKSYLKPGKYDLNNSQL